MEAITWVCFFGFVTLLSFLIYNLLSKPMSEDDKYEEERSHRKKNANRSEHIRIAAEKAEKAKEKKLKKQNKKQKKAADSVNVNTDGESENKVSEDETAVEPALDATTVNKKSKMPKVEEANTKKVAKEEVKDKKEVTILENSEPKDDKGKKVKQTAEKQVIQVKKQKVVEKPTEVKPVEKPVEIVQEKPVEVVLQPVQQQVAKKETVKPLQTNPKNKKKKNDANILQLKSESEAVNINLLIAMLKKAELSRSENQLLIDALLNKQQDDVSEWMQGPQDPTVKLKKQLIEVEEALKNEKEAASGMQVKLKELRAELNNERSSHKHMDERLAAAQNEAHAYSLKFQHAVEEKQAIASQHSNCIQQIKQFQKQLSDEKLGFLKLKEEHAAAEEQYHEAIRAVQNDYAVTSQQFQAEATALRSQLAMVQEQNMIVNDEYIKGKNELERVLGESQFQVSKLQTELNSANRALDEMKEELNHLTVLLNNSEMEKQSFAEKVERLSGQIVSLHAEIQSLRDQNESLTKKSSENWENGFSYNNKQDNAELEELKKTVKTLKSEVESKTNKVDELSMIVVSCKNETSKKDSLLQKALTEIETLKATVSPVKIIEDENLSQLKEIIVERNEEIANLKNEIETHKQRNNELRNKNWKAVEALKQAEERSLQNNKHEGAKENNLEGKIENWVKGLIQKVDSSIVIEDKGNQDLTAWLSKVDKALNFSKSESSSTQSSPSQYEGQINHLQHLVDNYKKIIVDTEGMLNELQNNVETREAEYKERIKELELLVEHQGRNPTQ